MSKRAYIGFCQSCGAMLAVSVAGYPESMHDAIEFVKKGYRVEIMTAGDWNSTPKHGCTCRADAIARLATATAQLENAEPAAPQPVERPR